MSAAPVEQRRECEVCHGYTLVPAEDPWDGGAWSACPGCGQDGVQYRCLEAAAEDCELWGPHERLDAEGACSGCAYMRDHYERNTPHCDEPRWGAL